MVLGEREPLTTLDGEARRSGVGLAASGALHALLAAALIVMTIGLSGAVEEEPVREEPARLVFLNLAGPGGGGGGGGLKIPVPVQRAARKSVSQARAVEPGPRSARGGAAAEAESAGAAASRADAEARRRQRSIRRLRRHRPRR